MYKRLPPLICKAEQKVQEVKRLMTLGSEFHAFEAMEAANREFGEFQPRVGMRYIWARLKEDGALGDIDTDGALEDFTFLAEYDGLFQSEGMLGRARMLHRKGSRENAEEILSLCERAARLDANVRAMMLMGFVFEHTKRDFNLAKRWYLRAYRHGQPWGLRFYAFMQFKRKKIITSALATVLFAITNPIMVKVYGKAAPFKPGQVEEREQSSANST